MGKIHLGHLLHHNTDATVVAVADAFYKRERFEKEYPGIFFTASSAEAMAAADAVVITTPTSTHATLVEEALNAGKHVFCEKPLDLSLETTELLTETIEASGRKVMLGYNRRFDPEFLQAKKTVAADKIGEVQIVKITNRDPGLPPVEFIQNSGGMFMDFTIHDFDMARYITGKEVKEVYAKGMAWIDKAVADAGDIDTALTTLTFEDGTYAVIDNSRKAIFGYDQRLEIFGDKGMIKVENNLYHRNVVYDAAGIHHALPLSSFSERYVHSYLKELEAFVDAVLHDDPVPVGVKDNLAATRLAYAAKLSLEKQRPVSMQEISAQKVPIN